MKTFGEQMKEARAKRSLTQEQLAARAQMSKAAIHSMEHSQFLPRLTNLLKVAWVLKTPFEFEYGGKRLVLSLKGEAGE